MEIEVRPNSVAVLGYHDGGAGQVASWFEEVTGYHIACFVLEAESPFQVDAVAENRKRTSQRTEYPTPTSYRGRPFIVSPEWLAEIRAAGIRRVLPLTPDNADRFRQIAGCEAAGMELVSAIHPTATILPEARIEPGVWINARSLIGFKAEVETGVLVNTGVQVDHHNVLRRCSQLAPGVVTAGFVAVHERAYVSTGAILGLRSEVGADAVVGAGAVVVRSIPPRATAYGVPARPIRFDG